MVDVDPGHRVVFDAHNVFLDGQDRVFRSTLHFRSQRELAETLNQAGFEASAISGWDGLPVTPDSPSLVVCAVRPT